MSEKTLEELDAELYRYQQINKELERMQKLQGNMTATSRLQTTGGNQQSMNMGTDRGFEEFRAGYVERMQKRGMNIKGRTYAEIVEELSYHRV